MAKFNENIVIGEPALPFSALDPAIIKAAEKNPRILAAMEDMGFPAIEWWMEHAPDRLVECGIAEANAAVVAAGLAAEGYTPILMGFMFSEFARALNQIRQSILVDRFNVKMIAREGVLTELGVSHATFEGVATGRVLPNLVILCPADYWDCYKAISAMLDYVGPVLVKMEFGGPAPLSMFTEQSEFTIGKGVFLKNGKDATIISTGFMTSQAVKAIDLLEKDGLDVGILNLTTIKPLDEDAIIAAAKESGAIVTAETNSVIGGLGEGVAGVLARNYPVPVDMIGIDDEFGQSGHGELIAHYGLAETDLAAAVKGVIARKRA